MTIRVYRTPRMMDKRVAVQAKTRSRGTSGGFTDTWLTVKTVWASIRNASGSKRDLVKTGGEVPDATHVIEMNAFPGLSPTTHRLKHRSTIYDIQAVDDAFERGVKMVVQCKTGVSRG